MKRRALLIAAIAVAARAQTVVWTKFDPGAVRVGRTDPAIIDVQTSGALNGVALDYAGGGRLNLTASGPNRWTASVDGQEAPIARADGLFRAVWLEAGPHRAVFRYRPRSFSIGLALSALGALAWAATLGRSW